MPRPSLDNLRGLGDYQSTYRWNMVLSALPKAGITLPGTEEMNLRCESSEIPKLTDQKIEINVRGHKIFQPGIHSYTNAITLTFTETVDAKVKRFIKAWRDAKWAPNTGVAAGSAQDLKGAITLQQLNNQDAAVWQYILNGVFPEDYELGSMDSGSDIQRPTVTFSYDNFTDGSLG